MDKLKAVLRGEDPTTFSFVKIALTLGFDVVASLKSHLASVRLLKNNRRILCCSAGENVLLEKSSQSPQVSGTHCILHCTASGPPEFEVGCGKLNMVIYQISKLEMMVILMSLSSYYKPYSHLAWAFAGLQHEWKLCK